MQLPRLIYALIILLSGVALCLADESLPKVVTSLGIIEGYFKTSNAGRKYEAYEGIPYARPPVGEHRFKVPKSISSWTGTLMAKKYSSLCLQYNHFPLDPNNRVEGSEDCLYLNVYAAIKTQSSKNDLLPVIFYIHGGAFTFGSGIFYGSKYLLDNDVIFVTINYRLGPLGFLSTEDETVPGNMGLKDQSMALRWVKDNILYFGGDPEKITIFGQSAGGASVHYHYMSKLSAGLFRGGWSLSGCALECWPQTEGALEKAKKLANIVGCPSDNVKTMVKCLRSRPAHGIVQAVGNFMPWLYNPYTPFGPVVEKGGSDGTTFIDRSPIEIINSGDIMDVPWITGITSEEGLYPAADFVGNEKLLEELRNNWETFAPHLLDFNWTIPKTDHAKVANLIKEHYLGSSPIGKSTVNRLVQMIGDRLFVYDSEEAARLQARVTRSPVRYYYFTYRGAHSLSEEMSGTTEDFGVSHADDLAYVIDVLFDSSTTQKDRDMQKLLGNLWVSFATKGSPDLGIEWPKVSPTSNAFPYLYIAGPTEIEIKDTLEIGEKKFWRSIDFRENSFNPNRKSEL
ncbi:venom carboxylesterase-6-like precursor [Athalia rosae]|uniref:Carboxylic ester hydrolase n=1 Tax=Athalia rosae TaxID=37344 RepID=Q59HJ3_ATHRO|nr:venom carboxylesterase-6-like precursor [Athalia rosae]BAD91554.1 juvenile hormone esterase [Athalia rosae]